MRRGELLDLRWQDAVLDAACYEFASSSAG
jgi:hypothetical protein